MAENAASDSSTYSADNIKVLEGLEAVRKRPGMYIGDTGERGLHHLVFEVVDNSIDEALAGYCDAHRRHDPRRQQRHRRGQRARHSGRDASRPRGVSAAEVVLTKLHAGGKFDKGAYKVSGGLHGVGVSVVNALSETLEVEIRRDGKVYFQRYRRGEPERPRAGDRRHRAARHQGHLQARRAHLRDDEFSFDILSQRLRELAFLNRGMRITIRGRARPEVATSSTTRAASSSSSST